MVEIKTADVVSGREYYIYEDVAGLFWPDDYDRGNHEVQDLIRERLVSLGCEEVPDRPLHGPGNSTPKGIVYFDSESASFECHSDSRESVEFVADEIAELIKGFRGPPPAAAESPAPSEMKNYTIVYVGKFASQSQADEVADGISQDADLAILVVRESTGEEIQGFNQDYLEAMTSPSREDAPPA